MSQGEYSCTGRAARAHAATEDLETRGNGTQ